MEVFELSNNPLWAGPALCWKWSTYFGNISIPPRGISIIENLKIENFIAPTCPNIGGDGQVDRAGAVGGGSGGIPDNGATCAEQRAGVGVRQNLEIED